LVGEGFDHPPLDTLLLAMPVSWKGTLQQYAGRLHRQQCGKTSVRIIDWLDLGHPVPERMWERRLRGYRAMGYELISSQEPMPSSLAGRPTHRELRHAAGRARACRPSGRGGGCVA
jgi:superfamily II DNA or RNA helicase